MVDALACAGRIARFRTLMAERGYDAAIIRNNPDLRWFTGAERTFDDETAHTAGDAGIEHILCADHIDLIFELPR